jgi:hypothetical protein
MQPSGGMAVRDCDGFDLLIGDWTKLVHNEYKDGNQYFAGQPAKIIDVILDKCGLQLEVALQQTTMLIPPNRLRFYGGKDSAIRRLRAAMSTAAASSKPVCPVCKSELRYLHGADYCNSCRMALWEIQQGLARKLDSGG